MTDIINEQAVEVPEEEMTAADLADICAERAYVYGFLARLFHKEVDEELLNELMEMHYPVASGNDLMDKGYYAIAKYLSNEWVDPITRLSVDYLKTFLGSGIDTYAAAYPYESVYTSEKRLLMQDARDEVLLIYRSCGLDKSETWKASEDHIAVELEFMCVMAKRAEEALRAGDMEKAFSDLNTQRNFLTDHIAVWVPVFTNDIRAFAGTQFYQGLADLTEGYLETDYEYLNELIVEE